MYGNTLGEKSGGGEVAVGVVPANETTVAVEMMNTQEVLQALSRLSP